MMEQVISRLDDLFTTLVIVPRDDMVESAMHTIRFIMDEVNYRELKKFEDGKLIRNYLLGIMGLTSMPSLIGDELSSDDFITILGGENEAMNFFSCFAT